MLYTDLHVKLEDEEGPEFVVVVVFGIRLLARPINDVFVVKP